MCPLRRNRGRLRRWSALPAAAKLAKVNKFAEKLPGGWNANIGENDCELSSGERQRISIARAFLKDAPIILLDKTTASRDVENETAIQKALSRLIRTKLFSSLPIGCAPFPARIRSWC